jgi:hypothetical protein
VPNRGPSLTVRPWDARDGDPAHPEHVLGVPVDHLIVARTDGAGALVALTDHRVALTGRIAAIGRHHALRSYVRSRAHDAHDRAEREWLGEVSATLERIHPESRA